MIRRSNLGVDTIGWLRQQLTGLGGFATMLYELLQNAEDEDCEWTEIEFTPGALIVRNPSVFDEADWDRITLLASGGKALEDSPKIGTFGVGFISVYQISDCPEIISAGEHAVFRPERQLTGEGQSIEWLGNPPHLSGTEFRLPWARSETLLRQRLEQRVVTDEAIEDSWSEAISALPDGLLFLRALRLIRLRRGSECVEIRREDDDSRGTGKWRAITIAHQGIQQERFDWLIAEKGLPRPVNVSSVRSDRRARIALAIPQADDVSSFVGRLFCFLPTQHVTGLRFHVHGTFFAKSDRKGIERDGNNDHVAWNHALLKGVAPLLGEVAPGLWRELGPQGFFEVIPLAEFESREFPEFNAIRSTLEAVAKRHPLVPDRSGTACRGPEVCFGDGLADDELQVLESLGARFVHPDVASYRNWLSKFGVQPFTLARLRALSTVGQLREDLPLTGAPAALRNSHMRRSLYSALARFLPPLEARRASADGPDTIPLAVSAAGTLRPFARLSPVESAVFNLFAPLLGEERFWEPHTADELPDQVAALCPRFGVSNAIEGLQQVNTQSLIELNAVDASVLPSIYVYFTNHKSSLLRDEALVTRFKSLAMFFATDGKLKPLGDLSLPGPFGDPLQLGITLDLAVLEQAMEQAERKELRRFLEDLGIQPLSLATYCCRHVTAHFANLQHQPGQPWPETAMRILDLLREHLREYQDSEEVLDAMRACQLVPCSRGKLVYPGESYLPSEALNAVFGEAGYPRVAHELPPRVPSWQEFYAALGVRTNPSVVDVVATIRRVAGESPSKNRNKRLHALYGFLNEHFQEFMDVDREEIGQLSGVAWIPIHQGEDNLGEPRNLFTRARQHIFESQAEFIAFEEPGREFREALGLRVEPEARLVVRHLLQAAGKGTPVHTDVYRSLNDHADEPVVTNLLRGKLCIDVGGGKYSAGRHVFFDEVPFGRYRHHLSPELQGFRRFFEAVGVRSAAQVTAGDYAEVLGEIAEEYGSGNHIVEQHAKDVILSVYRWAHAQIEAGQDVSGAFRDLRRAKSVLGNNDLLYLPSTVVLEDKSHYAEEFRGQLREQLIPKDRFTWRALHDCLDVRTLSEAVHVRLTACEGRARDEKATLQVQSRAKFFRRVIETRKRDHPTGWNDTILERIDVYRVTRLAACFELSTDGMCLRREDRPLGGWYDKGGAGILLTGNVGLTDPSFARVLATAVNDEIDPSHLIPLFHAVLAHDIGDVNRYLDEVSIDRLQESEPVEPVPSKAIERLGGDLASGPVKEQVSVSQGRELRSDVSQGADTTTETTSETDPTESGGESRDRAELLKAKQRESRPKRPDFEPHSYVLIRTGQSPPSSEQQLRARERQRISREAVQIVTEYEKAHRRTVRSREEDDCGYDLESTDESGQVRFIEVKGLDGEWAGFEINLTSGEFEAAWRLGKQYYLYVVDRIGGPAEPRLHEPVCNPARSGTYYAFDNPSNTIVCK